MKISFLLFLSLGSLSFGQIIYFSNKFKFYRVLMEILQGRWKRFLLKLYWKLLEALGWVVSVWLRSWADPAGRLAWIPKHDSNSTKWRRWAERRQRRGQCSSQWCNPASVYNPHTSHRVQFPWFPRRSPSASEFHFLRAIKHPTPVWQLYLHSLGWPEALSCRWFLLRLRTTWSYSKRGFDVAAERKLSKNWMKIFVSIKTFKE